MRNTEIVVEHNTQVIRNFDYIRHFYKMIFN